MKTSFCALVLSATAAALVGCGTSGDATSVAPVSVDGSRFLLAEEPDGAVGVIAVRESAKNGDPIVVVGRIGGASNPWVEGRAAFTLLDASMSVVANGEDDADGELCMDDCCSGARATCTTLVKVVDVDGRLVAADARQLLGITDSDTLVIRGKASKDESGNFVVLADGVHVRR
ncbi:MAG: hypothetical protein WD851_19355 [Pirellulales bacterium]